MEGLSGHNRANRDSEEATMCKSEQLPLVVIKKSSTIL